MDIRLVSSVFIFKPNILSYTYFINMNCFSENNC